MVDLTPTEIAALQRLMDMCPDRPIARYARHLEAQASRAEPSKSSIKTAQELALAVKAYGIQDGAVAIAAALDTAKRRALEEAANIVFNDTAIKISDARRLRGAIRDLAAAPGSPAPDEKE